MSRIKKILLWAVLLNKRFLRKPLFLLLLCLIPLIAFLSRWMPAGSGNLLTVGLCPGNRNDSFAGQVIDRLVDERSGGVVRYVRYNSEDSLSEAVYKGDIRLGFLFPDDLTALVSAYAKVSYENNESALSMLGEALGISRKETVDKEGMKANAIRVICGSNDIVTKMEKEHLFGNLYDDIEIFVLKAFMDVHAADLPMSKEERDAFLEKEMTGSDSGENFFQLADADGKIIEDRALDLYYLSPLRGLLAVTLILICFAACLFLTQDNRKGLFVWLHPAFRSLFNYLYVLIPVIDGGIFAYLALRLSGAMDLSSSGANDAAGAGRELFLWILYLLAVTGFSNLVRVLTRRAAVFSAAIPIVVMGCLFLTPIFFDLRIIPAVQAALPTYFYLKAIGQTGFVMPLCLYALITGAVSVAIDSLITRRQI